MPLYDYTCKECKHTFCERYKVDDRNIPLSEPCPSCGKEGTVDQQIGAPMTVSTFRLEGRQKPRSDFRERMKQIKTATRYDKSAKIKDY